MSHANKRSNTAARTHIIDLFTSPLSPGPGCFACFQVIKVGTAIV